jgi:hypothetical protein
MVERASHSIMVQRPGAFATAQPVGQRPSAPEQARLEVVIGLPLVPAGVVRRLNPVQLHESPQPVEGVRDRFPAAQIHFHPHLRRLYG